MLSERKRRKKEKEMKTYSYFVTVTETTTRDCSKNKWKICKQTASGTFEMCARFFLSLPMSSFSFMHLNLAFFFYLLWKFPYFCCLRILVCSLLHVLLLIWFCRFGEEWNNKHFDIPKKKRIALLVRINM